MNDQYSAAVRAGEKAESARIVAILQKEIEYNEPAHDDYDHGYVDGLKFAVSRARVLGDE